MILTYLYMILDEIVVITELEQEPIYMDVEELQPSPVPNASRGEELL